MLEHLLIFLVNLVYIPCMNYGLVSDDALSMVLHPYNIKRRRFFSLLIHFLVAQYIYAAFGFSTASFIAAILFSVSPMAVQTPAWMTGWQYGYNALVFLLVLTFAHFHLGSLFYIGAFGHTASCATLLLTPLSFLATKFWIISLLTPVVFLVSWKRVMTGVNSKVKGSEMTPGIPDEFNLMEITPKKLVIVVKTFWYYSLACLLPLKNGFYNSYLQTFGSSQKETDRWFSLNRQFWAGIGVMAFMLFLLITNFKSPIGFGIILFVTSIAPFLNLISCQQFTSPRYAYLPLIGFQIALWSWLEKVFSAEVCVTIASGLFAFYLTKLIQVLKHYKKTNVEMIMLDSEVFPDNPRIWYFRYEHMLNKNNPLMAWAEAQQGLRHLPEDSQLWFGLSCASFELHDYNFAMMCLKNSEKFMIMADRKSMQGLVKEMKERIEAAMMGKWKPHIANRRY